MIEYLIINNATGNIVYRSESYNDCKEEYYEISRDEYVRGFSEEYRHVSFADFLEDCDVGYYMSEQERN